MRDDSRLIAFLRNLRVTSFTDSDVLGDPKVGQWHGFGRTCLVEDLAAVPTVMFAVRKTERGSAPEANFGINPFRSNLSVHHRRVGDNQIFRWKLVT